MSNFELSAIFFLQLAVILAVIRLVGLTAKKLGQPQVVGEMIAGVVLGPSLFGLMFPELQANLFPKPSMTIIYAVSQVGVVIYMFLVGTEFRLGLIKGRVRSAASVSAAGILAPFLLGSIAALWLVHDSTFFNPRVSSFEASIFLGAAISITAFPMLARIIYERGLTGTSLGTLALAAGAVDDVTAWCLLAVVLASFSGDPLIAFVAVLGGLTYALAVLGPGRRILRHFGRTADRAGRLSGAMLSFALMLLMAGAWFTDFIGIYAVFGGFILGLAMPRGVVTRDLERFLEPVATNFMLPLFFVYSGLNTRLALVVTPSLWVTTLLITLIACMGKGVACWAAARLNGESNREALAIGSLMNARGLMELILLNIGLERGIISPTFFTIMVIMAIVTTLMATPIFNLASRGLIQQAAQPRRGLNLESGGIPILEME